LSKRDYYEVLGVSKSATDQEIKSAYRRQAVKHHPDKNPGDRSAEDKFKEAAQAYSVLGDPQKRAQYDRFGHSSVGGSGGAGFDPSIFSEFGDIFGDFFGFGDLFGASSRRQSSARRGADLRYDLQIDFMDAVFGMKTRIKVPRMEACGTCQGSGVPPGAAPSTCPTCHGQGQVRYQQGFFSISRTCHHCQGSGRLIKDHCSDCRGEGRLGRERFLQVTIPAGVDTGSRLRYTGEGEGGLQGGPPGDLYVVLRVGDHEIFERQENDIHCRIPISFTQAALGATITVPTLEGEEALSIPPGTQSGKVFRLRGKGIPGVNGRGRGDEFVSVNVVTPRKLNREQRRLLEQLAQLTPVENKPLERGLFDRVKDILG